MAYVKNLSSVIKSDGVQTGIIREEETAVSLEHLERMRLRMSSVHYPFTYVSYPPRSPLVDAMLARLNKRWTKKRR